MKSKETKSVDTLKIWSDNPRHGLQISDTTNMSERDIINVLIDVVGEEKMHNLAQDILNEKGLMGNVLPTVVEKDSNFCVYDGNRRISCIKFLRNPSLIDSQNLRGKISNLVGNNDLSFLDFVDVYVTDEEEALRLMDKTHGGEQLGVGVIAWDSYQRDVSLSKRNKPIKYPHAFNVASVLEIKRKSEFLIPYTDLDRLFGSKLLRETFGILELNSSNKKNIINAQTELLAYRGEKGFKSFSREFNIIDAGGEDDSIKPIRNFCEWCMERKRGQAEFIIFAKHAKLFEDELFDYSMLEIVIHSRSQGLIDYRMEDLSFDFFTPQGKPSKKIDTKTIGLWKIGIGYRGVRVVTDVLVQQLQEPDVMFDEKSLIIACGNSLNLSNVVLRAFNSRRQDMKHTLKCVALGSAIIENGVFTTENAEGEFDISFQFDNLGKQVATVQRVTVRSNSIPLTGKKLDEKLLVFSSHVQINISPIVNDMINEVNSLNLKEFPCLITASLRSLIELVLTILDEKKYIDTKNSSLENNLNATASLFNKDCISKICSKFPGYCRFHDTENFFSQFDAKSLAATLNLGAHSSHKTIEIVNLKEKAQKTISSLIMYSNALINL
ncbi:MAG: hypothetical protein FWH42_03790 [Dehalococcoidia bacterium]|nr:hypothetical protein [Dehalococcoidia bacterium]